MPPPTTLFWDIGGVLLTNGWDHVERQAVLKKFQLEVGPFEQRHAQENDAWEKGNITVWEYLDRTVFYEWRSFTAEDFFAAMLDQSQMLPDSALPVLKKISAAKNYTTVMLNNESAELHDARVQKFGLRELFDASLCSAYVGLRKPSQQIFRLALRVMQAAPEESVFIDDRQGNVDAAAAAGMIGIRYESAQQLTQDFRALGINF